MIEIGELKKGDIIFYYNRENRQKICELYFLCMNPLDDEIVLFIETESRDVVSLTTYSFMYEPESFSKEPKDLLVLLEKDNERCFRFLLQKGLDRKRRFRKDSKKF